MEGIFEECSRTKDCFEKGYHSYLLTLRLGVNPRQWIQLALECDIFQAFSLKMMTICFVPLLGVSMNSWKWHIAPFLWTLNPENKKHHNFTAKCPPSSSVTGSAREINANFAFLSINFPCHLNDPHLAAWPSTVTGSAREINGHLAFHSHNFTWLSKIMVAFCHYGLWTAREHIST